MRCADYGIVVGNSQPNLPEGKERFCAAGVFVREEAIDIVEITGP